MKQLNLKYPKGDNYKTGSEIEIYKEGKDRGQPNGQPNVGIYYYSKATATVTLSLQLIEDSACFSNLDAIPLAVASDWQISTASCPFTISHNYKRKCCEHTQ